MAVATIQEDPGYLWTNESIHFYANDSYDIDDEGIISISWDWGDGTDPSTLVNPVHVYKEPGTYTVTLTVTNQNNVFDTVELVLTVKHNYGDTDIVIRALDHNSRNTFRDPKPGQLQQVAVERDGWVAYLCDLKKDDIMEVKIDIIGDRPADVYLLKEVDFQTYKRNPQVTSVPSEVKGTKQGVTGYFKYTFQAHETIKYYVVIDNRDWPMGTETVGPVDYTISIDQKWETGPPPDDHYGLWIILAAFGMLAALAPFYAWEFFKRRRGD